MARLWSGDAGLRLMHEDRDVCRCRPTFRLFDAKLDQVVGTESAATAQCAAMHVEVRVTSAHDKSVLLARVVPLYLPALTPVRRQQLAAAGAELGSRRTLRPFLLFLRPKKGNAAASTVEDFILMLRCHHGTV